MSERVVMRYLYRLAIPSPSYTTKKVALGSTSIYEAEINSLYAAHNR